MRKPDEIRTELEAVELAATHLRRELGESLRMEREREARLPGRANCHGHWRDDDTCSYCGSMTAAEAIRRLKTDGTRYSGADWKYGWPHKFYIETGSHPHKFYNAHLVDASDEEFTEFARLSKLLFDIEWTRDENGPHWRACPGVQRYGVIALPQEGTGQDQDFLASARDSLKGLLHGRNS